VPSIVALERVRSRLALRQRFRDPVARKREAELRWWLEQWDPVLREGGLNPSDALSYLDEDEIAETYEARRRQQARAEVSRVVSEAELGNGEFFDGNVVLDIGPGPLGFPDACPARLSIGVEPLAEAFSEHGLLIPDSDALYIATSAEQIPLLSETVDIVLARNSLDHVEDPEAVLAEAQRILRPAGTLILLFDVEHTPTVAEPHTLSVARVKRALDRATIIREREWDQPFGDDGHRVAIVAEKQHSPDTTAL
jgi:SAM-dependent methyltransferase